MTSAVEPSEITEAGSRHHECVSVPSSDGITQYGWIRLFRQIAAIGKNGPMRAVGRLVENHRQRRSLDDSGEIEKIMKRHADRHAARKRTVLAVVTHTLQK